MNPILEITDQIKNDSENKGFTDKGWQPIFMINPKAKIIIIGPAPGIKTQEKGQVFRDKSGDHLREWLNISEDDFYNAGKIAVLPLDFYFPGKAKVGDLPPRKNFADKWHPKLLSLMPDVELIVLLGLSAQKYYLKKDCKKNLTETVFSYEDYLPKYFPLVHPSPLNFRWLSKNPEFETKVIPEFQKIVKGILL